MFHSFFPHVLETAQPDYTWRDSTALWIIRTLSRIDRIFMNLPVAEAQDFHCCSHVFENLGNRTIPSDHAAVRRVIQEANWSGATGQTHSKLDVQTSRFLFLSEAASRWPPILCRSMCAHLQSSKLFVKKKAKKADCSWALTEDIWQHGSKALNRLHCIARLQKLTSWDTHAMLWGMGARWKMLWPDFFWMCWLPEAQSDYCEPYSWKSCGTWSRDNESPLDTDGERQCASQMQSWTPCLVCQKNPCFVSMLSLMKTVIPWKTKMNQEEGVVSVGGPSFKPALRARGITSTNISCGMFRKLLTISVGPLIVPNLMNSLLWRKILQLALMEFRMALLGVRVTSLPVPFQRLHVSVGRRYRSWTFCWKWDCLYPQDLWHRWQCKNFSISRRASSFDAMQLWLQTSHFCFLSRPPLVHHEMHTSFAEMHLFQAYDRQHFWDRTTALAHVACAPQESGILLTDFAAAYPSVNHSRILSVIEKTELPEFVCRFLRSIFHDSITHVEFAGATRGHFLMARGIRQGCPASGFLFAMAFHPIFRWLEETVIPRNPCNLDFLQPAQCAYADDLAVAALSLRGLMTALGTGVSFRGSPCWPPFEISQNAVRFNTALKSVNPCGIGSLRIEGSFVRSKWSGLPSMLGPWSAQMVTFIVGRHPEKSSSAWWNSMLLPKVWLSDCVTSRFTRFLCWVLLAPSAHPTRQPSRLRTMPLSVHLQDRTTLFSNLLGVGSVCGHGPDLVGIHSISLAARYRVAACSTTLRQGLEKIQTARGHNSAPIFSLCWLGERVPCTFHGL